MSKALPLLLAGGAALLLLGKKKPKRAHVHFEEEEIVGWGELPEPRPNEVLFSPDLDEFKIGSGYKHRVLDAWLNERRLQGKLATVDHDKGILYRTFIEDPTTWLGDITGTGKVGGSVIYGALWLMATAGIGIYASGVARAGINIHAAMQAASRTRAMQILGSRTVSLAEGLYKKGLSNTRIGFAMLDFGGAQSLTRYGVGQAIAAMSSGAVGAGTTLAASILTEIGVNAGYSEDLAASAAEAAAEFTMNHTVNIMGEHVPIALLPSSNDYPAVQEFNKWIMSYIIRFQKMHFED